MTKMTCNIESSARLQLVPSVYCHVEIYYERFDTAKVVMCSERSYFVWFIEW